MQKLRIFIAGHKGMVGSALVRILKNYDVEIITKTRSELDLLSQNDVNSFFKSEKIRISIPKNFWSDGFFKRGHLSLPLF